MSESQFQKLTSKVKGFISASPKDQVAIFPDPFTDSHRARRLIYRNRWDYFMGNQRKPLVTPPGDADYNIIEPISTKIINDTVNFLFGPGVSFEVDPLSQEDTPQEKALKEFWRVDPRYNWNPTEFLSELGQTGAITGTAFVRLYVVDEKRIQLVVLDAGMVDIISDPRDYRNVLEYHLFWRPTPDSWARQRIVKVEKGWQIIEEDLAGLDEWTRVQVTDWNYEFAPIFHCKNLPLAHTIWGLSDIEHAALDDAINSISTDVNKILHYHAHPVTFLFGVTPGQVQQGLMKTGAGTMIPIPNVDAKVQLLEMESDLKASREYRMELVRLYEQVAGNVTIDPHRVGLGAMSGFALRILYRPILEKTRIKRETYGGILSQLNRAILIILGKGDPEYVTNRWNDPLPSNEEERARISSLLSASYTAEGAAIVSGYDKYETEMLMTGDDLELPDLTGENLKKGPSGAGGPLKKGNEGDNPR